MPEGRVEYEVTVDNSKVDSQVSETEQKIASGAESTQKQVSQSAGQAEKAVTEANKGIQNSSNETSKSISQIATVLVSEYGARVSSAIANAGANLLKTGISYTTQMESYTVAMTTALGSAEKAASVMAQIKADAARTPFSVDSLAMANQLLISTGLDAEASRESIMALSNAVSATGGGNDELQRMALNLQQIKNQGKASAVDIKQFAMAGIDVYGVLADYMGVNVEAIEEMEISYDDLSAAFVAASQEGGKYFGANEAQAKTLGGRINTLKDTFAQLTGELAAAFVPILEKVVGWLSKAAQWVIENEGVAKAFGTAIVALTAIFGALSIAFKVASIASLALNIALLPTVGIVLAVIAAVALLVVGIIALATHWDEVVTWVSQVWGDFVSWLEETLNRIGEFFTNIWNSIVDFFKGIWQGIVDFLVGIWNGLSEENRAFLTAIWEAVVSIFTSIKDFFVGIWNSIKDFFVGIATSIYDSAKAKFDALKDFFSGIWNAIKGVFTGAIDKIKAAFDIDWAGIGKNILEGVKNGIVNGVSGLINAAVDVARKAWEGMKNFLGIKSPSKKFAYLGQMSGLGFSGALEDEMEDTEVMVTRRLRDLTGSAKSVIQGNNDVSLRRDLSVSVGGAVSAGGTTIVVPLYLDSREVARATAYWTGEQLSWWEE